MCPRLTTFSIQNMQTLHSIWRLFFSWCMKKLLISSNCNPPSSLLFYMIVFYYYWFPCLTAHSRPPQCNLRFLLVYFFPILLPSSLLSPQVDGVSLQGCSEQRAMEVLRRTGPLVRLRLLRKAVCLSHILPPVPPLQPLRHSHSFHEGNPYRVGLNQIQETGASGLRDGQHIDSSCCNGTLKPTWHRHEVFVHSRRSCYFSMFCLGGWRTLRLLASLVSAEVFFTLTALRLDRGLGCVCLPVSHKYVSHPSGISSLREISRRAAYANRRPRHDCANGKFVFTCFPSAKTALIAVRLGRVRKHWFAEILIWWGAERRAL